MGASDTGNWLAVKLEIPEGQALAGVQWYNNDAGTIYDQILVGTGFDRSPGELTDFVTVAESVQGGSSTWSQIDFDFPVAPSLGALYVVFVMPENVALTARGAGGGPGLGYGADNGGLTGWLCGGDAVWARLHDDYGFCVAPEFVPLDPEMFVKSLDDGGEEDVPEVVEPFMTVGPNPFNPVVTIRFGLKVGARANLDVFDLRGRRVRRLVDGYLEAGVHELAWRGRDDGGRGTASGVYFLKLSAGEVQFNRRVMLVR